MKLSWVPSALTLNNNVLVLTFTNVSPPLILCVWSVGRREGPVQSWSYCGGTAFPSWSRSCYCQTVAMAMSARRVTLSATRSSNKMLCCWRDGPCSQFQDSKADNTSTSTCILFQRRTKDMLYNSSHTKDQKPTYNFVSNQLYKHELKSCLNLLFLNELKNKLSQWGMFTDEISKYLKIFLWGAAQVCYL